MGNGNSSRCLINCGSVFNSIQNSQLQPLHQCSSQPKVAFLYLVAATVNPDIPVEGSPLPGEGFWKQVLRSNYTYVENVVSLRDYS